MRNTILTPQLIAREALMVLEHNLVMAGLVHRDYEEEFAHVGDTITIRKPVTLEAKEFDSEIELQDVTETSVAVTLDKHLDISFALGPKELTLDIDHFSEQFIQPAMRAHAQKIDALLCSLYREVPSCVGTAGTPPGTLADLATVRKVLNKRGVPLDRRALVIDPEAEAKLLTQDAILHAEKSGSTDALRYASLGRGMGAVYRGASTNTTGPAILDQTRE